MVTADDLAEFNAGIQRARREYERAPIRACDAHDACPGMTHDSNPCCGYHRSRVVQMGLDA